MSITTFGAPQRHGQRSYQMQVYEYDTNLAEELINSEGDLSSSEYQDMLNGLSETAILNRGLNFNEFIVNYQEVYYTFNEESGELDKSFGEFRRYNPRQNQYFKPIVTIRDVWSLSDRSSLTTTAYASFGRGGGEALNSTPGIRLMDGTINLQETWNSHQLFEFSGSTVGNRGFMLAFVCQDGSPMVYTKADSQIIELGLRKAVEKYIIESEESEIFKNNGDEEGPSV